jgi:hypothetical protein
VNEIDHFKVFILCSCDVTADVDHLHVKIIHQWFLLYSYREFAVYGLGIVELNIIINGKAHY